MNSGPMRKYNIRLHLPKAHIETHRSFDTHFVVERHIWSNRKDPVTKAETTNIKSSVVMHQTMQINEPLNTN